ncbi:ThiF family adenylyltransferase [Corynebacterium liangguodongii]|uniref:Molybdopterin biosynthesis protein MoeB n=1 Tax=Corynebacterium liangguodongii TaxID=2079535 RepID=A0A2S0WDW7_9CORY|nr:ThiF family adenylyltransferase [Corynebacterium liangguodongii]AWB83924.1 molybdopterin biosynthesis protein MoeB [Corynebacterium liangguodongii]PWB99063.1 molybdopterin biosynthesis protein MoeB [Corynebacterium liangguodongii]
MDAQWIARYRRQITLQGFGQRAQERLGRAHVVVVGAGGLGAPALLYLAGAGVGRLTIVDADSVELSNLHRQVIHTEGGIGTPKASSAAAEVRRRNSAIEVRAIARDVTADNAAELIGGADLVLDGTDNFAARYAISRACAREGIPHVWASILGFDAQVSVYWAGHGPCYEDIFPTPPPPGAVPSCADNGVLGPVVGVVGTTMALEAVKVLAGVGQPLIGRIGYFDGLRGEWEYIELEGSSPAAREDNTAAESTGSSLIDVREPEEYRTFHLPGARNVPLSLLRAAVPPDLIEEINREGSATVYCTAGVRSAEAIGLLEGAGARGLAQLEGGLNAWLDAQESTPE